MYPLFAAIDATIEPCQLNGDPGAVLRDRLGRVVGTMTLDVLYGRIQAIRSVVNPTSSGTSARSETVGPWLTRSAGPRSGH